MLFITLTLITAALAGMGMCMPVDGATHPSAMNLSNEEGHSNLSHIICQPQMYREARHDFTMENLHYIAHKDKRGLKTMPAGPRRCERFACQYGSAIYVCNDNDVPVDVSYATVAEYALAIVHDPRPECNWRMEHYEGLRYWSGRDVVLGQAFDVRGWNVIVGMWHSDLKCP